MKIYQRILLITFVIFLTSCNSDHFYIIPFKRYIVSQNGMYPSLEPKVPFWVKRKPLFKSEKIRRGEIVVFYIRENEAIYDFIWRVIGLPGDTVRIEGTSIYVNNQLLEHEKRKETSGQIIFSEKGHGADYLVAYDKEPKPSQRIDIDIVIPAEHLFLLGDNRDNAMDSRFKGCVPFSNLIGIKMK